MLEYIMLALICGPVVFIILTADGIKARFNKFLDGLFTDYSQPNMPNGVVTGRARSDIPNASARPKFVQEDV